MQQFKQLHNWLWQPVDIAFLVCFRIAFGGILLWNVQRYFYYGWVQKYWLEPAFHFTYPAGCDLGRGMAALTYE